MIEDEKEVSNIADKVVLLDTSRQLETKDLNTENKTLKIENERLKRENHSLKLELRSFKLEQLVNQAKNKLNEEGRELLENMLQAQSELANNKDNSFAQKQLEKTKKILQKKLTEEEIQNIMDNHKEISKLEKEFGCLEVYENVIEIPPKNI
jgi:hypothetical protein